MKKIGLSQIFPLCTGLLAGVFLYLGIVKLGFWDEVKGPMGGFYPSLVSGILLGIKRNILAFCLGVIIAGLYVSYLLIFKKVDVKKHIAFAPFLVVGIVILLFYGNQIIMWYMY